MESGSSSVSLPDAFVEDHRVLTQGFAGILDALREGDLPTARRLAERIDREAGPHIEFEERFLYPIVEQARGHDYAARLYQEHSVALDAICWLTAAEGPGPLEPAVEARVRRAAQTALDHAVSCGTLLSYLTSLDDVRQRDLLGELLELRRRGRRWRDLARVER